MLDVTDPFEGSELLFQFARSGKGCQGTEEREEQEVRPYERNTRKYICAPANAYLNHPKVEKNLKELEDLPALQLKILETQASYVRPGGTLLYSTCTVLKRENEDVVSAFLAAHGGFTTEPLPLPDVFPKNETGMLTLIPGEYDTDGFFICRLRRKA